MSSVHKGSRLAHRYKCIRKLGEGAFASVYEVQDTACKDRDVRYAVKIEKRKDVGPSVKQEHKVLQRLKEACPHMCHAIKCGSHVDGRFFIVMHLLGMNLVEARKASPGGRMPPGLTRSIALCVLDALQAVHSAGYIHRDIKPANITQVPLNSEHASPGNWVLVDFGLARKYLDAQGAMLPPRPESKDNFRGSTTYASVHAHTGQDLGRRDDLLSWLYVVAELLEGTLPWRGASHAADEEVGHTPRNKTSAAADGGAGPGSGSSGAGYREAVLTIKQQCMANPALLVPTCPFPGPIACITQYLSQLEFAVEPDYDYLRKCISQLPDNWGTVSAASFAQQHQQKAAQKSAYQPQQQQQQQQGLMHQATYQQQVQYSLHQQQQQQHCQHLSHQAAAMHSLGTTPSPAHLPPPHPAWQTGSPAAAAAAMQQPQQPCHDPPALHASGSGVPPPVPPPFPPPSLPPPPLPLPPLPAQPPLPSASASPPLPPFLPPSSSVAPLPLFPSSVAPLPFSSPPYPPLHPSAPPPAHANRCMAAALPLPPPGPAQPLTAANGPLPNPPPPAWPEAATAHGAACNIVGLSTPALHIPSSPITPASSPLLPVVCTVHSLPNHHPSAQQPLQYPLHQPLHGPLQQQQEQQQQHPLPVSPYCSPQGSVSAYSTLHRSQEEGQPVTRGSLEPKSTPAHAGPYELPPPILGLDSSAYPHTSHMVLGEPKPVGIPQPHLQQGQPAALEQAQAAMPPQPHLSPFKPHSQQQQQQQVQVQQQQAEALLYGEGTTYAGVHHPAAVCSVPVMEVRDWGPLAPPGEGHEEQPTEASMEHRAQRSNIRHSGHSHQEQQEQGHAVFSNKRARLGHPNPTEAASVSAATMNGWQRSQHPHHDDHPLSHALANCKRLGQQQQQQQQQRGSRAPYFTPSGPQGAPACGQDLSGTKQERAEEERALDSVQRAMDSLKQSPNFRAATLVGTQLAALPPTDALAVMAGVVGAAVEKVRMHDGPDSLSLPSQLTDLAVYIRIAAQRAEQNVKGSAALKRVESSALEK